MSTESAGDAETVSVGKESFEADDRSDVIEQQQQQTGGSLFFRSRHLKEEEILKELPHN